MNCPKCGVTLKPGSRFCENCGASVTERAAPTPPQSGVVCPQCGAQAPAGNRFCVSCGAALDAAPAPQTPPVRVCPSCGTELTVKRKFCIKCAANVEAVWDAPAPQAAPGKKAVPAKKTAPVKLPALAKKPAPAGQTAPVRQAATVRQTATVQTTEVPAENVCPKCGAALGNGRFCTKCGAQAVKAAANMAMRAFEHRSAAPSAPGEVKISLRSVGGDQLTGLLGAFLK